MIVGEVALQGTLSTSGTVLFTVPLNFSVKISSMRYTNPTTNYVITFKKYSAVESALIEVYTLNLNAGDILLDDFIYYCTPGEYLEVTSDVVGTTYYVIALNLQTAAIPLG